MFYSQQLHHVLVVLCSEVSVKVVFSQTTCVYGSSGGCDGEHVVLSCSSVNSVYYQRKYLKCTLFQSNKLCSSSVWILQGHEPKF